MAYTCYENAKSSCRADLFALLKEFELYASTTDRNWRSYNQKVWKQEIGRRTLS